MDTKHNGWTNYATWRVNLEMFDGLELGDITFATDATIDYAYEIGQECKAYVEATLEESGQGLCYDYALAFISDVNWYEIAEHLIQESEV